MSARLFVYALQQEHLLLVRRRHLESWKKIYMRTTDGKRRYATERDEIGERLRALAPVIKRLKRETYDRAN